MDVREISDRIEIQDLLTRYARAIDTGDWDGLDTVFTPDAAIDYREAGGIHGSYAEVKPWLAEMLPIFPRRMHSLHQVCVDLRDDEATVAAYFHNPMILPQPDGSEQVVELGGIYHHELIRTPDGWRSRELTEEIVWKRGL